jgi:hypothetical protein
MVKKELLDEAIDHAVITMRNVRIKPHYETNKIEYGWSGAKNAQRHH